MDTTLPKIDSLEALRASFPHHLGRAWIEPGQNMFGSILAVTGGNLVSVTEGEPPEVTENEKLYFGDITEHNFWRKRESMRFCDGTYRLPVIAPAIRRLVADRAAQLWFHFPHQSLSHPEQIAFTPNHEYGLRDRQVTMKVGKYLKKFYGEVLTDEQIRDIANQNKPLGIKWAYGCEEIRRIYLEGPTSCMSHPLSDYNSCVGEAGTHPVEVYGYQYKNGDYEFGLAYIESMGVITARCLVALKAKVFTRTYGDDGPILDSKLAEAGYKLVCDMSCYDLRLMKFMCDDHYILPYLDGDGQDVENCGDHFVWTQNGDFCCDSAGGSYSIDNCDDSPQCDICGDHTDELSYSEYHEENICNCCADNFVYAYYGAHSGQTLVAANECIEVDGEWYRSATRVLAHHDIVLAEDDSTYYAMSDCFQCVNGLWHHEDDKDEYVECSGCYQNIYAHRDNVTNEWRGVLVDGEYVWCHPDHLPVDAEHHQIVDNFGNLVWAYFTNPLYMPPGQIYAIHLDECRSDVDDLCEHMERLADEWLDSLKPVTPCVWVEHRPNWGIPVFNPKELTQLYSTVPA